MPTKKNMNRERQNKVAQSKKDNTDRVGRAFEDTTAALFSAGAAGVVPAMLGAAATAGGITGPIAAGAALQAVRPPEEKAAAQAARRSVEKRRSKK